MINVYAVNIKISIWKEFEKERFKKTPLVCILLSMVIQPHDENTDVTI